ncbi:Protein of unknown function [Butyrivibrio fibrisolvens DSM 3071]|uniref:Uncharacterized protein n=1 Tax=Butyrivibrio fibrisolvens DSM 3071 TaxID=1121131 RepID=A0A1M5YPY8_BUTFI|nr:DUF3237 family protein [Butyrivibrio fibrisolvens]SHI13960.1 Protein of unknown function [Butyrivibrio fibrisolvens DSM 3071]
MTNLLENAQSGTEILTIDVILTEFNEVKGHSGDACMILFNGYCHCDIFNGDILNGGVDTQKQDVGSDFRSLSARYILQGKDFEGKDCRIFIENNGVNKGGDFVTTPKILTDSEALKVLENMELVGSIGGTDEEGHIQIHIKVK